MAQYSELIKHFDKIRDYMRDFYVYGFKTRDDFTKKSLRSYDNEKRRIESYLADTMSFRQDENGKNVFISVNSASIPANPLYRAFKAKTFTKNDIALHFYILDILAGGRSFTAADITEAIAREYSAVFKDALFDLATVRNKCNEYAKLGIFTATQQSKKLFYSLSAHKLDLSSLQDALTFFSEVSPLGVAGSYLLDACGAGDGYISFKHHYILHALDSEITYSLCEAMQTKRKIKVTCFLPRAGREQAETVTPLRFLISVTGGRQYVACYSQRNQSIIPYRIDGIKKVELLSACEHFNEQYKRLEAILANTWGISFKKAKRLEKVSIRLYIPKRDDYILRRLYREGRNGSIRETAKDIYEYEIEVYDSREMLPWARTFIGRIVSFTCSNKQVAETFYKDLNALCKLYEVDANAV